MTLLRIEQVSKRYGSTQALSAIDLNVEAGSRTAIVGPSGSGKSTLLRIVAGFEAPDEGCLILSGETLAQGPSSVPAHRRDIGIVSQDGALFPHLSVFDNIGFGLSRTSPSRESDVLKLMDTVELARTMRDRRPHQLSGGQQQRVALARALARKPRLMLLDEPFSSLDTGLRENMRKAVGYVLKEARITSLLVTHDQAEALSFADQMAVLRDGKLVQCGAPADLYFRPKDRATAAFLGDAIILPALLRDGTAHCALGCVPIDNTRASGRFDILLRPEQLSLVETDSPFENPATCYARVTGIDFGGASCTISIALQDKAMNGGGIDSLTLKYSSIHALRTGANVRVGIAGTAHILPDQI